MASDGAETEKRIEETVLDILKVSNMESMTESKVRAEASKRLGLDLSVSHRKKFVRRVVESFLASQPTDAGGEEAEVEAEVEEEEKPNQANEGDGEGEEVEEEEEEEEDDKRGSGKREYERDESGDPIICALSSKRRVTIQEFRGKTLVSIREFYDKDGKQLPSSKGVSLTVEQWEAFRNAVPRIEDAIKQLGGSID
ncbi:RNA polymerase II transcriptional coactivator KELP [Carex littledalei]|uniref:RNA polymerase II transcriptional coactivator KELP n=1 Tax=Carex littledalei TaxID=544730 RepID=A0A833V854_9POAL|nr:RNA polymerase II transcriptional coactivator KELP [Carex littledalei]